MGKARELTGQKFYKLTFIRRATAEEIPTPRKDGVYWLCRCDCGKEIITVSNLVTRGRKKSCGCLKSEVGKENIQKTFRTVAINRQDLVGQKFGEFTVIKYLYTKDKRATWLCHHDDGHEEEITTHDLKQDPLRIRWRGMKSRCYDKSTDFYKNYGGRGIKVCDEWLHNFDAFKEWAIKNGFSPNLTLDRIDVNGNYEPNNCRWITMKEQCYNKRNTSKLLYKGNLYTYKELSELSNLSITLIRNRLRLGWELEKVLTTPKRTR